MSSREKETETETEGEMHTETVAQFLMKAHQQCRSMATSR